MGKLRSSSSSSLNAFSFYTVVYLLHMSIYLLVNATSGDGFRFKPLIQLQPPRLVLYKNSSKNFVLNIDEFGAKGDGITDDSETLHDVWKIACSLQSPAKIVIPSGSSYLVKPTDFAGPCKSNVTLRVSGVVVAPEDPNVWEGFDVHKWLYFHGVENLTVEGGGIIDGAGSQWWTRSCKTNESNPCTHAPTAITFHRCNNLKVRSLMVVNSQQMHLAFSNCMHVSASHLTIVAPADSPNTDGLHISASRQVEVKDTLIATGDDCISIVSNSSHIRIKNIVCGPGHGISIGSLGNSNSCAVVQDVLVEDATLFNTDNGVRIKTWQGGSGFVRKISFVNITMQNVSNPIIIDQYYCDSPVPCLNQTTAVTIDSISFVGITGTSATEAAITFSCSDSSPCTKLHLEDVQLVPSSGTAKSFCWKAYGTSSGMIYPPSCISSCEFDAPHDDKSESTDEYAYSQALQAAKRALQWFIYGLSCIPW